MKAIVIILALLFVGCSTHMIRDVKSAKNMSDRHFFVKGVEFKVDKSVKGNISEEQLSQFKKIFRLKLSSINKRAKKSIPVKMKLNITNLRIKGVFARINRLLGGLDKVHTDISLVSLKSKRQLKSYKAITESGFISKDAQLFEMHAMQILNSFER